MKPCIISLLMLITMISFSHAEKSAESMTEEESKSSPWLVAPLFSSDPKISTAGGAIAAYVHEFDDKSPASMMGFAGTYSTTDSWYLSAFAKLHLLE